MTLIRCRGHKFNKQNNSAMVFWYCIQCGLKVTTQEAASYLTGKTS